VYLKGSEPHDYCKASEKTVTGNTLATALALTGLSAVQLAEVANVPRRTIIRMVASAKKPVSADAGTVDKVVRALEAKGVEIAEDGVHLMHKPRR